MVSKKRHQIFWRRNEQRGGSGVKTGLIERKNQRENGVGSWQRDEKAKMPHAKTKRWKRRRAAKKSREAAYPRQKAKTLKNREKREDLRLGIWQRQNATISGISAGSKRAKT
jgi:hypothetical protein